MTTQLATVLQDALGPDYRIEQELDGGGMSRVFLATDLRHDRRVVVKVLSPELASETSSARFKREIELTVRLQHPHILPILTSGGRDDTLYYISPFIPGESLKARIEREGKLPLADIVKFLRDVSGALAFAHQRGIVHRDVKPGNILLAEGHAILADFGIARAVATNATPLTNSGMVPGTPAYMAPELPTDEKADVYALGVVAYEMLCGVLPKRGVTAKEIVAARGKVAGDSVESVSSVAAVIALALAPAADTRLPDARSFHDQLEGARGSPLWRIRAAVLVAVVVAVGALIASVVRLVGGAHAASSSPRDSTRILVLVDSSSGVSATIGTMFRNELSGWKGLTLVDPAEIERVVRTVGGDSVNDAPPRVAIAVGAGRYVRVRMDGAASDGHVSAGLFDVASARPVALAHASLPVQTEGRDSAIARLAADLLIGPALPLGLTRVVPAAQEYLRAQRALAEWDLDAADSALVLARSFDPEFGEAAAWQAEVRNWRADPVPRWSILARQALTDRRLSSHQRSVAAALVALAEGRYASACAVFDSLASRDGNDFAALFGAGECRRLDDAVIRDTRSSSGWRFRSSYQRAALMYAKAFEALPLAHQGVRRDAFSRIRRLLRTNGSLRPGVAAGDSTRRFLAYPVWEGDTLNFIPFPSAAIISGIGRNDRARRALATERQQALFRRVAAAWSAALPQSPGAKEAMAVALDMLGDSTAVDTLRLAERLEPTAGRRLPLAAERILLSLKYSIEPPRAIERVRESADSLLRATPSPTATEARALISMAVLVHDCDRADALTRRAQDVSAGAGPSHLIVASRSLLLRVIMKCDVPDVGAQIMSLWRESARNKDPGADALTGGRYGLLGRLLAFMPADTSMVNDLAAQSGDYVLRARAALSRRDTSTSRSILSGVRGRNRSGERSVTPDAALLEAQLLIDTGDRAAAERALVDELAAVHALGPDILSDGVVLASIVRTLEMRGRLAGARGDRITETLYRRAATTLWKDAG